VHILAYIPAVIMLLLIMMPMGISRLATTELAVTNKRIIGRMRKQRLTIPFEDVETVRIRRSILGLIFNYGSVSITGNGIRVRFPGITKPSDIKSTIDTAVEHALFPDLAEEKDNQRKNASSKKESMPKAPEAKIFGRAKVQKSEDNTIPDAFYKDPNSW